MRIAFSVKRLRYFMGEKDWGPSDLVRELSIATMDDGNLKPSASLVYSWLRGGRPDGRYLPYLALVFECQMHDLYERVVA